MAGPPLSRRVGGAALCAGVVTGVLATLFVVGLPQLHAAVNFGSAPVVPPAPPSLPSVSVVVLNWRRLQQLRLVVRSACHANAVTEVIVVNQNPGHAGVLQPALLGDCNGVANVSVVELSRPFPLHVRFAAGLAAANDVVVVVDDDMAVSPSGIDVAAAAFMEDTSTLMGPWCRWPLANKPYDAGVTPQPPGRVAAPIILTKFLVAHRQHLAAFFNAAPDVEALPVFSRGVPPWNGEDVVLSLATVAANAGALHRCRTDLRQFTTKLPSPHGISNKGGHYSFRAQLVTEVSALLGLAWKPYLPESGTGWMESYPNDPVPMAKVPVVE